MILRVYARVIAWKSVLYGKKSLENVCVWLIFADMIRRIRAYFRRHRILMAQLREWDRFIEEVRRESIQDGTWPNLGTGN